MASSSTRKPRRTSSRVIGRLRKYLKSGEGREFNAEDSSTPEGRLANPESVSWHVPTGREPWLRTRQRGVRARDVKSTDIGQFKLKDFTTRASDERGHHKSVKISMPEQMMNELTAICDSHAFPVRNIEALARTLIYEGLEVLHEITRQHELTIPGSHMQQLEAISIINRGVTTTLAYDDMLEESCNLIRGLVRKGIKNKARTALFETMAVVKKIESRELRERWQRDLEMEFRGLMRGRPAKDIHMRRRKDDTHDDDEIEQA